MKTLTPNLDKLTKLVHNKNIFYSHKENKDDKLIEKGINGHKFDDSTKFTKVEYNGMLLLTKTDFGADLLLHST